MHLGDNIHAARFKEGVNKLKDGTLKFIKNPIKATSTFIKVTGSIVSLFFDWLQS